MRTPGKPWRAGQPDRARQTRKRAKFYGDESSHKLRRTKRGRVAERPRRGGWGQVEKESRLKKDECADELWVLLLHGTEYHCEEWEHMGIAVCCQQAYWHHRETQAVIKSYLIYSPSVLLSCFLTVSIHTDWHTHTHTQSVLHRTERQYVKFRHGHAGFKKIHGIHDNFSSRNTDIRAAYTHTYCD